METNARWIDTATAAEQLKISPRAVQRRCKAGKLRARLTATPTGQQWEIDALSLDSGDRNDTNDSDRNDIKDTQAATPTTIKQGQTAATTQPTTETTPKAATPTTQPTTETTPKAATPTTETTPEATTTTTPSGDAILIDELRDQVKFLRSALEARDRDAAELRAALREALRMSARALPEGDASPPIIPAPILAPNGLQARQDALQRDEISPTNQEPQTKKTARNSRDFKGLRGWLLKVLKYS